MPQITLGLGILLTLLGLVVYLTTGHFTALIPAFFGVPILIAGLAGLNEAYRKHAMHAATLLALLGLLGALGRPVGRLAVGEPLTWNPALASQVTMAALCGLFVILAVKSFVDARRRRPS